MLSIMSLVCLLLVFLGGLSEGSQMSQVFYHYKIDVSQFKQKVAAGVYMVQGSTIVDNTLYALEESAKANKLADFYNIYLWNYCSGAGKIVQFCLPAKAEYYFDPMQIWSMGDTLPARYMPSAVSSPMDIFARGARWLFVAYQISVGSTALSLLVGMFGICSRFGSFGAAIISGVSGILEHLFSTALMTGDCGFVYIGHCHYLDCPFQ
jgi:hypothetical protein